MSLKTIAFSPHNARHRDAFVKVGNLLRKKFGFEILYVHELGDIDGERVFEFDKAIKKKWADIDVSLSNLCRLEKKYPNSKLTRALYSERRYNFFPKYFNDVRVPYETQLRYLVGCFIVFEEWLDTNKVDYVVSELLIGLPDSILYTVCKKRDIKYISLRSSKLLPGIITCSPDIDLPTGFLEVYDNFVQNGIPNKCYDLAKSHIDELRLRIRTPSYMQLTKKNFRLVNRRHLLNSISRFGKGRVPVNDISLSRQPMRKSILWNLHRFFNIRQTKKNESRWFCEEIHAQESYFVFPLQYEPEATTLVRAFPFSNQMCVIQQIAKALPLGVTLVVKEHRGNHGYRKAAFYKEVHYLPNVRLVPREADVHRLLRNSIGVITLSSRMGWEALVLEKPVIAFGSTFWTDFDEVKKPGSWLELKGMIDECFLNIGRQVKYDHDEKLLAYAAAYISLTHEGNFVPGSEDFLTALNIENIANFLSLAV